MESDEGRRGQSSVLVCLRRLRFEAFHTSEELTLELHSPRCTPQLFAIGDFPMPAHVSYPANFFGFDKLPFVPQLPLSPGPTAKKNLPEVPATPVLSNSGSLPGRVGGLLVIN